MKSYKSIESAAGTERLQAAIDGTSKWCLRELHLVIENIWSIHIGNRSSEVTYSVEAVYLRDVKKISSLGYQQQS